MTLSPLPSPQGSSNKGSSSDSDRSQSSSPQTPWNRPPPKLRRTAQRQVHAASQQKQRSLAKGNHPLVSLNLNLDSLAKQGAAPRAQELLQRIEALHQEGYYAVAPDAVSYNSVLNAWARSSEPIAEQQALELFSEMQVEPNLISFNTLILAFAKHGQPEQAEAVLRAMPSTVRPDTISYNSVLYGWALSRDKRLAPQKAEEILREMVELCREGHANVKPDTISFNTVLHAWANSYMPHGPKRAEDLLRHMENLHVAGNSDVEPDVYSYTTVIKAWATSQDKAASYKAKALLETMEGCAQERPHLKPNYVTYSCVISALGKSGLRGAAQEAQSLLERMMTRYKEGDVWVKPDTVAFSSVIDAWARDDSPHAAERALELLETMKQLSRQRANTHNNDDDDDAIDVQPNALTYTSVFTALGRSREGSATDKAEALLEEMHQDRTLQPSTIHYNAILNAHAKSPRWDKAQRAQRLMQTMEARQVTPDVITFNSVLAACANSFGSSDAKLAAFSIAMQTLDRLRMVEKERRVEATPITYFFIFKALRKLLPPGEARWKQVQEAFQSCCQSGLLNEHVLGQVRLASSEKEWKTLLQSVDAVKDKVDVLPSDLPNEWTCRAHRR